MTKGAWLAEAPSINRLPRATEIITHGLENGLHIGAQVCVRHRGETIADFAMGDARAGKPLRTDHRILWLSAGKPLVAMAIARLWEQGLLAPEDPVAQHLPEFGSNGKEQILLWHVMTHTAAYQPPPIDWPRLAWTEIIAHICESRIPEDRKPGEYAAYDAQTGWYLLAEIVWRLTALPYYDYVQTELLEPLGCSNFSFGMDGPEWTRGVENDTIAPMHDTAQTAREVKLPENTAPRWPGDDAKRAAAHNPGGGAMGPVRELCRVYEALAEAHSASGNAPGKAPVLQPDTMAALTRRWREDLYDHTFRHKIDWGLGVIINSNKYGWKGIPYGFGRHAGEGTFGHGGMQSTIAFADPEHDFALAATFNGLPGEPRHQKRARDFATAVYEDIGIA